MFQDHLHKIPYTLNNAAEKALRPPCLGRRSWLFRRLQPRQRAGGGDVHALISTAKLNDVDPQAWLDELLPWNWQDVRRRDLAA